MKGDSRMAKLYKSEGDINISPQRDKWQKKQIDAKSRALLDEDARYFLRQSLSTPCLNTMRACEGIYIEDMQGNRYMDFHGNNVHQVGFGNPEVIAAVKKQLDELSFCTRRYTNQIAVELAKKLAQIAPGKLNKSLFCPGGAEAVGIAVKLARIATGRHKTISMWDSFHGATLDTISIGGEAIFRQDMGPLLPGTEHAPPPDEYRCVFGCSSRGGCDLTCANYVEYILEKEGDIAAVISEPIGRTGKMFTFENFGVTPDIVVLGKGLGGGIMPFAGIIANEKLDVAANRALGHYTHEKSPVASAAALATINYIEKNNLVEHASKLGQYGLDHLNEMKQRHSLIGDVRGLGLFLGIELVKDQKTRERAIDEAETVMYESLTRGLSFKLTITKDEMDQALAIIEECISQVETQR
jgi:4-aminobutyrate aminotransferase